MDYALFFMPLRKILFVARHRSQWRTVRGIGFRNFVYENKGRPLPRNLEKELLGADKPAVVASNAYNALPPFRGTVVS